MTNSPGRVLFSAAARELGVVTKHRSRQGSSPSSSALVRGASDLAADGLILQPAVILSFTPTLDGGEEFRRCDAELS